MAADSITPIHPAAKCVVAWSLTWVSWIGVPVKSAAAANRPQAAVAPETETAEKAQAQSRERADKLFETGRKHYQVGEFEVALPLFREAYEISHDPALLFNVAQCERLRGDCQKARAGFEQFLRKSVGPDEERLAEQRRVANIHLQALWARCPAPAVPAARPEAPAALVKAAVVTKVPERLPPAVTAPVRSRKKVSPWVLGAGGAAVASGLGAGGMWLWNRSTYSAWQREDDQLMKGAAALNLSQNAFNQRQEDNNDRWRDLGRRDRVAVGLSITAAVLAAAAVVIYLVNNQQPESER